MKYNSDIKALHICSSPHCVQHILKTVGVVFELGLQDLACHE